MEKTVVKVITDRQKKKNARKYLARDCRMASSTLKVGNHQVVSYQKGDSVDIYANGVHLGRVSLSYELLEKDIYTIDYIESDAFHSKEILKAIKDYISENW